MLGEYLILNVCFFVYLHITKINKTFYGTKKTHTNAKWIYNFTLDFHCCIYFYLLHQNYPNDHCIDHYVWSNCVYSSLQKSKEIDRYIYK